MCRPLSPCSGSDGKAALRPGKLRAFLTEADVHPKLSDQTESLANHRPHPPLSSSPAGPHNFQEALPVLRSDGAGGVPRLSCLGGKGGAAPGHPQLPSRLSSLEMQGAAVSLGSELVPRLWAAESGPHWSPALSGGDPLCLPASSVSAAGHTACRSPCQPPGQTGLAGCLPVGGAVTQLLPGPGQTSLRSARLQSEALNQASLHPARRRTVLGAGGQRLSHPRSCPTRGPGGSRGPLRAVRRRGGRGASL